jgi:hypothetical protein
LGRGFLGDNIKKVKKNLAQFFLLYIFWHLHSFLVPPNLVWHPHFFHHPITLFLTHLVTVIYSFMFKTLQLQRFIKCLIITRYDLKFIGICHQLIIVAEWLVLLATNLKVSGSSFTVKRLWKGFILRGPIRKIGAWLFGG